MTETVLITEFGFRTEVMDWFCEYFAALDPPYPVKVYGCLDAYECPFEYIPLPNAYRRMDRVGISYAYAYAFSENREAEKIVHIDNDVWFRNSRPIKKVVKRLDRHAMVGLKANPIHTSFFGLRTEVVNGMTFDEMARAFFDSKRDFFRVFARDVFKRYRCSTVTFRERDFIHYGGLQRAIERLQTFIEKGSKVRPKNKIRVERIMGTLYEWSQNHAVTLDLNGKRFDAAFIEEILKGIEASDIEWEARKEEMRVEMEEQMKGKRAR